MTKLLILTYDFPPYVSVGGLRPYSWFKYLHLYDVYPIVITRQWNNKHGNELDYISPGYSDSIEKEEGSEGTIIRVPFKPNLANRIVLNYGENKYIIIRKFINFYYQSLQFILPIGGKQEIYNAADEFLKHNKVDCIIATGDPFILFKYASELSEKYSTPWIADYRDAWIQDLSLKGKNIYRKWHALFERKFLEKVSKITTVSTFIQKQIERNIKNKKFEILYNGYDPEIIELTKNIQQDNNSLSIALVGTIYQWHPIESFLRVCNQIIAENPDIKLDLHFYGINNKKEIKEMLRENYRHLEQYVHIYPRIANLKLVKKIAKHNVFLLFNYYSMLGTKIFDYLAVKRKMILCYENDPQAEKLKSEHYYVDDIESESTSLQADMIKATNSGIVIRDAKHLKKIILELSDELKENGFIKCESTSVDDYSRIKQVKHLAEIIKEFTKK